MGDDMAASVGGGGVDGRSPGWPKCGQSPGRPMAVLPRRMVVVVVVVVKGKDGIVTICDVGDVSTAVARFGNPHGT